MKKKIMSFVLAMCLFVPAMFLFTACGQNQQITKEEWNNALDWKGKTNVHIYCERDNAEPYMDEYADVKYDGTNIYCKRWDSENPESSLVEMYYIKKNNNYWFLQTGAKNDSIVISQNEYESALNNRYDSLVCSLSYDDFEYDNTTDSYVNAEKKLTIKFTFEKDKLTKIEAVREGADGLGDYTETTTITFENVEFEVPNYDAM